MAKKLASLLNDPLAPIIAENHLASVDFIKRNYCYAIEKFRSAREKTKKLHKKFRENVTNNDLGHAYFQEGNYEKAREILNDDIKTFKKLKNYKKLGHALYSLGEIYRYSKGYDEAEKLFNEVIQLARMINNIEMLYRAYNGLGNILDDIGNYSDSIGYFERAFDLATHVGDHGTAISFMINVAIDNSNLGNEKNAFDAFQTVRSFLEHEDFSVAMRDKYLCRTYLKLGEIYRLRKKFNKAKEHLKKSLEKTKIKQSEFFRFWVLVTQAKVAADTKDHIEVERIIKEAEQLAHSPREKECLKEVKKYISSQLSQT